MLALPLNSQQRTPIDEPKLFAEGVISTPFDEFGAAFSMDGKTVFFSRSVPRSNLYTICQSVFSNGHWSEPVVAPFAGQYWDFDPVFSPDGRKLFFASDRPVPGHAKKDQDFDIWVVEQSGSGWTKPTHLNANVNSGEDETFASVAANGTLYFVSAREGGRAHLGIYRSRLVDGVYAPAEKLKGPVNDPENSSLEVVVAPDESFLLLVPYGRAGGFGSFDIYVSYQHDGVWMDPKNLGPKINTRARDYSPRFSLDGKYLFWASERGFTTDPRERPLTYSDLRKQSSGTLNGWGNIYQIDLSAIGLEIKK
ncbi:MAG TPA: hypothetical protein VGL53_20495 [Bryobacteraceae bacterium]|jgi:Tol biopolymer transport system component